MDIADMNFLGVPTGCFHSLDLLSITIFIILITLEIILASSTIGIHCVEPINPTSSLRKSKNEYFCQLYLGIIIGSP